MRSIIATLFICLALAGCARDARLYPANDIASAGGVLHARFMAYGTGNGSIEIRLPSEELLTGEYSIVRGGSASFGAIYGQVYGPVTAPGSFSAGASSYTVPGGSPGMASMFGDKGTRAECEFYNDNFSGHGNGACRISNGALYRLQY